MNFKEETRVWKKVFGEGKYIFLSFLVIILFFSFNALVRNFKFVHSFYSSFGFISSLKITYSLIIGFKSTLELHSFVSLVIISFLFGALFSLILYKTNTVKKGSGKTGVLASIGIFLGVLAPGCAACGLGFLPLLGISAGVINFFPFDGLEISILSIAILVYSSHKISEEIHAGNVCKLK